MTTFPRFLFLCALLAAPVCHAQLPPSMIKPGVPVPVQPAPISPLGRLKPAGSGDAPAAPAPAPGVENGPVNALTAEEAEKGWKLLFDGQRLIGMRGVQRADPLSSGWKIQNGELVLPKSTQQMERVTGGDLITAEEFWDFEFRFECKLTAAADSGVRYMSSAGIGQTASGLEYQICDGVHGSLKVKGNKTMHTGALLGILPVGDNARLRYADPLNKIGDPWNEGRILVQGNHVEHWLNGQKAVEFELGPKLRQLAAANKVQVPLGFGNKGRTRISILDQGFEVSFRNLKVLPIPPQAVVLPPAGPR